MRDGVGRWSSATGRRPFGLLACDLVWAARQQLVESVPVLTPDSGLQPSRLEVEPAANPAALPPPDRLDQPRRRGTGLPQPLAALRCSVGAQGRRMRSAGSISAG